MGAGVGVGVGVATTTGVVVAAAGICPSPHPKENEARVASRAAAGLRIESLSFVMVFSAEDFIKGSLVLTFVKFDLTTRG